MKKLGWAALAVVIACSGAKKGSATTGTTGASTGADTGSTAGTTTATTGTTAGATTATTAGATTGTDGALPNNPSSVDLIEHAQAEGTLTLGQSYLYTLYALFRDARLPAAYQGDDANLQETHVFEAIGEHYAELTSEDKAALEPFLRRPEDPASEVGAPAEETPGRDSIHCSKIKNGWSFETDLNGHVKVWYRTDNAVDAAAAATLKNYIEATVWPKLYGTLGLKAPKDDTSLVLCDGGDAKLDLYLVDMAAFGDNATDRGETFGGFCKYASSYILINHTLTGNLLLATTIHEMMHATQWGYSTSACHSTYGWFNDATANWGIDYVDSGLQSEQDYSDCVTRSPHKGLEDRAKGSCSRNGQWNRDYGSYLFFQFMSRSFTAATVKAAFDNTESHDSSLDAVNAALPHGFKDDWLDYAKALYNNDPVDAKPASFNAWDAMHDKSEKKMDLVADLGGVPEIKTELEGEINNLSAQYYRFTLTDPLARSVLFRNTWVDQHLDGKAIRVFAYWKDAVGVWHEEDWSTYEFIGLCRDIKSQRATELVVIVANGEYKANGGGKLTVSEKPYLKRNNVGCWKFTGTAHRHDHHSSWSGNGIDVDEQLVFEVGAGADSLGFMHPQVPKSWRVGGSFVMQAVGSSYTFTESYATGCSYSAGPVTYQLTSSPPKGFLMTNPFPELTVTEPTLQEFIHFPRGTYTAAGVADPYTLVTESITGPGCPGTGMTPVGGLLLTNGATEGHLVLPPAASDNGNLVNHFEVNDMTEFTWNLTPQSQP